MLSPVCLCQPHGAAAAVPPETCKVDRKMMPCRLYTKQLCGLCVPWVGWTENRTVQCKRFPRGGRFCHNSQPPIHAVRCASVCAFISRFESTDYSINSRTLRAYRNPPTPLVVYSCMNTSEPGTVYTINIRYLVLHTVVVACMRNAHDEWYGRPTICISTSKYTTTNSSFCIKNKKKRGA